MHEGNKDLPAEKGQEEEVHMERGREGRELMEEVLTDVFTYVGAPESLSEEAAEQLMSKFRVYGLGDKVTDFIRRIRPSVPQEIFGADFFSYCESPEKLHEDQRRQVEVNIRKYALQEKVEQAKEYRRGQSI